MRGPFSGAMASRFDGAVSLGRDAHDLGETEVFGAEFIEALNQLVRKRAADAEVVTAEVLPGEAEGLVQRTVADLFETRRLLRRAAVAHEPEGLAFTDPGAEFDRREFVHDGSRKERFFRVV
jgi:hypothetical protein